MIVIKDCIAVIKKDISAIKQFFVKLFTVTNPIIDYPIIILTILNLISLTLIFTLQAYFLKLNIPTAHRGTGFGNLLIMFLGYFSSLLPLLLTSCRNDVNLLKMEEGSEPFTRSVCIVLSMVFAPMFFYTLSKELKYFIGLFIQIF